MNPSKIYLKLLFDSSLEAAIHGLIQIILSNKSSFLSLELPIMSQFHLLNESTDHNFDFLTNLIENKSSYSEDDIISLLRYSQYRAQVKELALKYKNEENLSKKLAIELIYVNNEGIQEKIVNFNQFDLEFRIKIIKNSESFQIYELGFSFYRDKRLKRLKEELERLKEIINQDKVEFEEIKNLDFANKCFIERKDLAFEDKAQTFFGQLQGNELLMFRLKGQNGFLKPSFYSNVDRIVNSKDFEKVECSSVSIDFNFELPDQQELD